MRQGMYWNQLANLSSSMTRQCIIASFYIAMQMLTSSRSTIQALSSQLSNAPVKNDSKQNK